jgi:hypothetical protein
MSQDELKEVGSGGGSRGGANPSQSNGILKIITFRMER